MRIGSSSNFQNLLPLLYLYQTPGKEVNIMLTYKSGHKVKKGTYWDLSTGHRIDMQEEGVLMGRPSATYVRMSSEIMLLVGPIIGLLYVLCVPFISIATIAALASGKAANGVLSLIGKSLSFGWRPKEAYLSGKKKGKKDAK
jgi:hypothetical protein